MALRLRSSSGRIAYMRRRVGHAIRGDGPVPCLVVFAHANGMCKEVWRPVWDELAAILDSRDRTCIDLVAWDAGGQGDSKLVPGTEDFCWSSTLVGDLREVMGDMVAGGHPPQRVVGVGHSMGAASLVLAELAHHEERTHGSRPIFNGGLLLVEPILLPNDGDGSGSQAMATCNALATRTLKRKATWPSLAEARSYLSSRPTLAVWDPRAVEAYFEGALEARADGTAALKCTPAVEAGYYRGPVMVWDRLGSIGEEVDVCVQCGETSTHMDIPAWGNSVQVFAEIEKRMGPRSKLEVVPGAGHFVVMEQPKAVARALARLLLDSEQALRSAL